MDIRGSTKLCEICSNATDGDELFKDFMTQYHRIAREEIVKHGGVFDRVTGDGISGIFNLYNNGIGDYRELSSKRRMDDLRQSRVNALREAISICNKFMNKVVKETIIQNSNFFPGHNLRMGGALVTSGQSSTCFVGSAKELVLLS